MTGFAIGMPVVYDELEAFIRAKCTLAGEASRLGTRWKEGVAALRTEKVLLVIRPFTQLLILQGDIVRVGNGGLTMVATRREILMLMINVITHKTVIENRSLPHSNPMSSKVAPRARRQPDSPNAHHTSCMSGSPDANLRP